MIGLLVLYVKVIFLTVFGCLTISRGISLTLNIPVSISDFGYFCSRISELYT